MDVLRSRIERINLAVEQLEITTDNDNLDLGHMHALTDKLMLGVGLDPNATIVSSSSSHPLLQQDDDNDNDNVSILDKYHTILANSQLIRRVEQQLRLLRGLIDNVSSSSLIIPCPPIDIAPILQQRLNYLFNVHFQLMKSSVYLIDFIFSRIVMDSNARWIRIQNDLLYSSSDSNKSIY